MARRYESLSSEAIDEIWLRLRAGHETKPTARQLGSRPARCAGICCGAAGSDRIHDAVRSVV